ncbi:hypothetical protein [Subtercola boreus]|nr:hypothetical protein [Subtercola boreus]
MRTTDFRAAPVKARAEAMVIAEFSFRPSSPELRSPHVVRGFAGYVWHRSFRRAGVRGIVVLFDTGDHAQVYRSALRRTPARTRLMIAEPGGYSNGVWRAEGHVMAHIPTFTPTSVEAARGATGPPVTEPAGAEDGPDRRPARGRRRRPRFSPTGRSDRSPERPVERPVTDAGAMFVGATKYRGPTALLQLSRTWYPMVARMQTLRGYVWHTIYWEPPFTLGTLAFFASRDDLLSFARLPAHRALMQWITRGTRNGTGGYIRLHLAPETAAEARGPRPGGAP